MRFEHWAYMIPLRLRSLLRRERVDAEVDEELRDHIERQTQQNLARGMNAEEARRAALIAMGGLEQRKQQCRETRGLQRFDNLARDLVYGLRSMCRNPGFTGVALATLALGIGANTAIFSLVNGVMLRPLPYPHPDEIVHIGLSEKSTIQDLSVPEFQFLRDHATSFASIAGWQGGADTELNEGTTKPWVTTAFVTDGFFRTLGVKLELGHPFGREFTRAGGEHAVVLTNHLWHSAFDADPNIVGRQVVLGKQSFLVVGVLPPGFKFEQPADVFASLPLGDSLGDQGTNTAVLARLKPGVSLSQAQSEVRLIGAQFLAEALPAQRQNAGILHLDRYRDYVASDYRTTLLMLLSAVGLLLLIACANISSLLLARASFRQKEISIRLSLGATRGRLLQQFLVEGLLLGASGAVLGLTGAAVSLHIFVSAIPAGLPSIDHITLDWRVLLFTMIVAIGSSVVFGLASFFQTRALDPNSALKGGRGIAGAGRRQSLVLNGLVVGEVAFSVMLVLGAGLLIDSLYRLNQIDPGFNPANLTLIHTPFSAKMLPGEIWSFERQALTRIQAIPGVRSAAVISVAPLHGKNNIPVQRKGHPRDSIGGTEFRSISSGYFSTMGIPLFRGRAFQNSDFSSFSRIAIINETLARDWWPDQNPIGDQVVIGEYRGHQYLNIAQPTLQVVGVVGDTKGMLLKRPAPPMIYVPASNALTQGDSTDWVIRTNSTAGLGFSLRKAISGISPNQRITDLEPMTQLLGSSVAETHFEALLMGSFAGLALALTLVGVYGVLSFQIAQRTQEIGIRLALGATRRDVRYMVMGKAARVGAIGVLVGLISAFSLTRFMASLLYEVHPTDPAIFALVAVFVLLVALAAAYIPGRRAAKVDPVVFLRCE